MTGVPADGQPLIPLPERDQAALRTAVAQLNVAALPRFDAHWTAATAQARDESSPWPPRHFIEHWWMWVAVHRWPRLAARLAECERIFAESPDRAERRAAGAEIGEILNRASSATG